MNRTIIAGAAAATFALSGAGIAVAAGGAPSPQEGGDAPTASARTLPGVTTCNGGKQKRTWTKANRTPYTFGEGADVLFPGMKIQLSGPAKGKDTLNLVFSAESQLRGGSDGDKFDWMELEVLLDGSPVQPYGSPGDLFAFTGSPYYAATAAQFCTRIGKGKHTVEVRSRLVDNGTNDTLTGWVDETVLNAVVSE